MKVFASSLKNSTSQYINFKIQVEEEDNIAPSPNYSLKKTDFYIKVPNELSFEKIHPDHLALISLLVCHPFIGRRIVFPKLVSKDFFDAHKVVTRYIVEDYDCNLESWSPKEESKPALAYSGGADSTAALAIMPKKTVSVFLDRPISKFSKSLYNKDAPIVACQKLNEMGYDVNIIESNLESVRAPIGFPVDVANAAPLIILANFMNLDSIAFGTIMESTYRIGHKMFLDYEKRAHFKHWGGLFKAAGLPFLQVVAGVSEVGTAIINNKSPLGIIAHSCMRGKWMKPCKNCWKCFRKLLLDSVIIDKKLSENEFNKLFKIKEAKIFLSNLPIKHENVLSYSFSKYIEKYNLDINEESLASLLAKRVRANKIKVDWLEKYYPPMFSLIPEKYKQEIENNLKKYLLPMNEDEQQNVLNWDMTSMIEDKSYIDLHQKFSNKLKHH